MWPVLFSLGQFQLTTMSVMSFISVWLCGFVLWRKVREEHYPEDEVFDGFILSTIWGLVAARIGYIVLNFSTFGWSVLAWLDIFGKPGTHFIIGMIVAGWYLKAFAKKRKWDDFEILDFWVMALAATQAWLSLGTFLAGTGYGVPTSLPWGIVFPGVFAAHHPVQLYWLVTYLILWRYLAMVEYRYRLFNWYRAGKSSAQSGFLTAAYIIVVSVMSLVWGLVSLGVSWQGVRLDLVAAVVGILAGAALMWNRSGHTLPWPNKR